jgi:hypothetical protein
MGLMSHGQEGRQFRRNSPERLAAPPKLSKPSLRYLASHARIAIHVSGFSHHRAEMAQRTRNKIAPHQATGLERLPANLSVTRVPGNPHSRVEES